jgi:four helix bundle protein
LKAENRELKSTVAKETAIDFGTQGRLTVDFRNRGKRYASSIIKLFVALPKHREEVRVCAKQLLRSGTSVAAHLREASRARSDEEFVSKLGGALQEADEAVLWLELLRDDCGVSSDLVGPLERESSELIAILITMIKRTRAKLAR